MRGITVYRRVNARKFLNYFFATGSERIITLPTAVFAAFIAGRIQPAVRQSDPSKLKRKSRLSVFKSTFGMIVALLLVVDWQQSKWQSPVEAACLFFANLKNRSSDQTGQERSAKRGNAGAGPLDPMTFHACINEA
jgi:hypothetical protein